MAFFFGVDVDWFGVGRPADDSNFDNSFGERHVAFLSQRSRSKPSSFGPRENSFRGVRSGIRRKTKAILDRINAGDPKTRAARQQDKRAAKYLLAAFGAIHSGHDQTFHTIYKNGATIGIVIRVARTIWLQETMRQFNAGESINLDSMYEANIKMAIEKIQCCDDYLKDFEIESFNQVCDVLNFMLGTGLNKYEESLYTLEDRKRMALTGEIPDPLGLRKEIDADLHTNHIYLSKEDSKESLEAVLRRHVRDETYKKVVDLGWKRVRMLRARCYKLIERGTIESVLQLRWVMTRILRGDVCLGKRKTAVSQSGTELTPSHERHLIGPSRAIRSFLSMRFDLALHRAMT